MAVAEGAQEDVKRAASLWFCSELQRYSLFAIPESYGVKYDLAIGAAFESEPWTQFVFFVDDRDGIVFVSLAMPVDDHAHLAFFVFDDQIDPLSEFYT